jgi:beta-lactamase regulating signal transducer with metallopeptidase domain
MAPWIDIAGWTLVHFVWQGTAIAVVAAIGLRLLRAASPHARYGLASAAMAAMLIAPIATATRLAGSVPVVKAPTSTSVMSLAPPLLSDAAPREQARRPPVQTTVPRSPRLDAVLPAIVLLWLAGVALLQLRLLGGWWRVRGLHRASLAAAPASWQTRTDLLARRLGMRRLVHVVEAHAVDIPSVIGWWRPIILLPIGALAGLTPAQADAILVHELAHIGRLDYVVNALQHVVETLLFYHPAVWWISRRMRLERELCCDAIVVHACGDPIGYAAALVELEAGRSTRAALAVAATDGSLMARIRILLTARPTHRRPVADAFATAFVTAVLVAVAGGGYRWTVRASADVTPPVQQAGPGAGAVVVTVNGEAITDGDLRRRHEFAKRERPDAPLSATLAAAIDEQLVMQRGRQLGYAISDDEFRSVLRNLMAQNGLATDAALQKALAQEHMTLADLRRNLESSLIVSRVRLNMTPTSVSDQEAREYFAAHLDAFPLQTFELARPRIDELLGEEHRGRDWRRYLQTLRSTAVLVWQQPELQRAYETFRAQNPQGRADVLQPPPAPQRPPDWHVYSTGNFEIFFKAGLDGDVQRVERDAQRAYRRLSSDLRHDLSTRPNLVLFATSAERDRAGENTAVPGTGPRILLALDRPDDRFQADVVHEITHAFEFDILPAGVPNGGPSWIWEGLAEHEGELWAAGDDDLLRGLIRMDRVPALSAFENTTERRLPYAVGHAAFDFIRARWGLDGIRSMFFSMRQRQATDRGVLYSAAFGVSAEAFDQAFEQYLRDRFPSAAAPAPLAPAGQNAARRVNGQKLSEQLRIDTKSQTTTDTVTLAFAGEAADPAFTIDFITQHIAERPIPAAGAVDVVVTQWPTEDTTRRSLWLISSALSRPAAWSSMPSTPSSSSRADSSTCSGASSEGGSLGSNAESTRARLQGRILQRAQFG